MPESDYERAMRAMRRSALLMRLSAILVVLNAAAIFIGLLANPRDRMSWLIAITVIAILAAQRWAMRDTVSLRTNTVICTTAIIVGAALVAWATWTAP